MKIFYSWQSDIANSTNRGFISDALETAIQAIKRDESLTVEPVIDRDTEGVPGSPNIADTILKKIDSASMFLCDVTIVNSGGVGRPTPNPNVLIELGYAMKSLGMDRIILIQNTSYGMPERLPFDLRQKRALTYSLKLGDEDKPTARRELAKKIESAIRHVVQGIEQSVPQPLNIANETKRLLDNKAEKIQLHDFVERHTNEALVAIRNSQLFDYARVQTSTDELASRIAAVESACTNLEQIFVLAGAWADSTQTKVFGQALKKLFVIPKTSNSDYEEWRRLAYYPALRLMYSFGIASLNEENYPAFKYFVFDLKYVTDSEPFRTKPITDLLNTEHIFARNFGKLLPDREQHYFPASDYLEQSLQTYFRNDIAGESEFSRLFDRFEYYLSLAYAAAHITDEGAMWVPMGSFVWRKRPDIVDVVDDEIQSSRNHWPLLNEGCFISLEALMEIKQKVDEQIQQVRIQRGFW